MRLVLLNKRIVGLEGQVLLVGTLKPLEVWYDGGFALSCWAIDSMTTWITSNLLVIVSPA